MIRPPLADDIDWCLGLTRSSAVLWRAMANPLVHATEWYWKHKQDEPVAILDVICASASADGGEIEIVAHSVAPADRERLARGMAEAVVEYAMECELNGEPPTVDANTAEEPPAVLSSTAHPPRRHLRVMIRDDAAPEQ